MTAMSEMTDNISVEVVDESPCRKVFKINVSADMVSEQYTETLKLYQKSVRVQGFRPGKAPAALVQNHYRKQIQEELQDRIVPYAYRHALDESKLDVVSVLEATEVNFKKGEPVNFEVKVDVAPQFDLPTYKGIKLKSQSAEITDEEVDKSFEEFLSYYGNYEDVSGRPVEKTDLVQVDYTATLDGTPLVEVDPEAENLSSREDFWVRAGEEAFLPGFGAGLIGMSAGDSKDIEVTFDEKFVAKNLAGKTGVFATTVKAIREKVPPELNAEFFEKIQVESEEDLKQKIRVDLEQAAEQKEQNRLNDELVQHLLDATTMDLPDSEVVQETQSVIQDIVRRNTSQGIPDDQIVKHREEIFQAAEKNAQNSVKLKYILHRISEEEGVEVSDQEFDAHIAGMAVQYRMEPEELMGQLKHRNALDRVRSELRHRKTMEFVMEQASISA